MKRFFYFLFFLALIATTFVSCVKEKLFPVEPSIEYKQFNSYSTTYHTPNWQGGDSLYKVFDRAECIIKFKDGDGDIGGDSISTPDLKLIYLDDYVHDYSSLIWSHITGNYVPYDQNTTAGFDTLIYTYRVPDITPNGQYKAIEGEILIKLAAPFAAPNAPFFKYQITLRDRAGHQSNTIITDSISNTP